MAYNPPKYIAFVFLLHEYFPAVHDHTYTEHNQMISKQNPEIHNPAAHNVTVNMLTWGCKLPGQIEKD